MRIKNIKLSFLILGGLMILSFAFFSAAEESSTTDNNVFSDSDQDGLADTEEKTYGTDPLKADTDGDSYSDGAEVKAGYDPTKPAPGDRVVEDKTALVPADSLIAEKANLTKEITDKVSSIVSGGTAEGGDITMTDIQSIVDESLNSQLQTESFPEINKDEIKIKEQNYDKLPEEKQQLKKKEDFLSYLIGVSYILSSNSPLPVTSESALTNATQSMTQQITSAITTQSPAALDGLATSGEKIMDQMKEVEVPQEVVDLHIKGLQFSKYAIQLKDGLAPNPEDPMAEIVNLSKMQGLVDSLLGLEMEMQSKLGQYNITSVKAATEDMKKAGVDVKLK